MSRKILAVVLSVLVAVWFSGTGRSGGQGQDSPTPFFCGDSNGDGQLDLSDPVHTLNFLFLGGPEPQCALASCVPPLGNICDEINALKERTGCIICDPATGNLGIGMTPIVDPVVGESIDQKLQITASEPTIMLVGTRGGSDRTWRIRNNYVGRIDESDFRLAIGTGETTGLFSLDRCGNLFVMGTLTQGSSRELKEDVVALEANKAFGALRDLHPVRFNYKADAGLDTHVGFIAEDSPDIVTTPDKKAISPMDVVAVLTKVVQEQQKTINALEGRLKGLEAKVGAVEGW